MSTRLDREGAIPSAQFAGILRALGVNQPGEAIAYEGLLRLIAIGLDVRDAGRGVNMPETGWNAATANFAGEFSGFTIIAGAPGCWVAFAPNDTGDMSIERYTSIAQLDVLNPVRTFRFDWTDQWQWSINQRPEQASNLVATATKAKVIAESWPNALTLPFVYNNAVAKSFMLGLLAHHQTGLWVPPGGVLRIVNANNFVPGVNTKLVFTIREPLE